MGKDTKRYRKMGKDRKRWKKMQKDGKRWESTAAVLEDAVFHVMLQARVPLNRGFPCLGGVELYGR